jgi:hypothetical protein
MPNRSAISATHGKPQGGGGVRGGWSTIFAAPLSWNLVRAGVPQTVAMRMTGHKTDSVFRRYDIASPDDLRVAAERLKAAAGCRRHERQPRRFSLSTAFHKYDCVF